MPERFADDLRRRRRAEELAAAAGRCAGAAADLGRLLQRDHRRARSARRWSAPCPASSAVVGSSVTPPGTSTHGRSCVAASAIIIAGSPLSHVATPSTPRRVGSERISRRNTIAASLRYGRLSNMPVVPCVRPSHGSVHEPANGIAPRAREFLGGRLHQQADFPVTGVIAQRDRRAVRRADAAVRREDQELLAAERRRRSSPCRRSASSRTDRPTGVPGASPRSAAASRPGRPHVSKRRRVPGPECRRGWGPRRNDIRPRESFQAAASAIEVRSRRCKTPNVTARARSVV